MSAIEDIKQAREYLKDRNWPKSREILFKVFPTATNAKFVGELVRAAVSAQRTNEFDLEEHLLWLAIEIYESGRDENADVLTAIRLLAELYNKNGRSSEVQILTNRTFMSILIQAEGLLRSVKSLTKQLAESERQSSIR
jgi:hypothetical protein